MKFLAADRRRHLRLRKDSPRLRIRDETASTLTHFCGFILSILGLAILLWLSIRERDAWRIVSSSVYGITLVTLYAVSTLYHLTRCGRRKLRLRLWDHCAIFLFIAGSYTPFVLVSIRGGWGWSIFGLVWAVALIGIFLKAFVSHRASGISTGIYLLMGWLCVIAIVPLWNALQAGGMILLVAGGLAYSAGTLFFALDHRSYYHAAWHLCVLGGSALHFLAIALYVLPAVPS